ncbi:MAG: hypothetical protein JWM96_671 [Alphaproteobacteria bacterium]|nr:hypothetical protein [Alphaproteobacteria bacterium]
MNYALYLDACKKFAAPSLPDERPAIAYWRLIDCDEADFEAFDPDLYPHADFTIAEIHPAQLEKMQFSVNRLSIVPQKSVFRDMGALRARLADTQCDITFNWDKRFSVDYYIKMLRFWLQCGVQHVSFYELKDFAKWQRLQSALREYNFHFYDRFHACLPGYESPYQKHLAGFGNLLGMGGWSRLTEDGMTRTKGPGAKAWENLSDEDQMTEKLLFGLADRDGMALDKIMPPVTTQGLALAIEQKMAIVRENRLIPTDEGLWDTVTLLARLQQV